MRPGGGHRRTRPGTVDVTERGAPHRGLGVETDDPVDGQPVRTLQVADRALRDRPEVLVDDRLADQAPLPGPGPGPDVARAQQLIARAGLGMDHVDGDPAQAGQPGGARSRPGCHPDAAGQHRFEASGVRHLTEGRATAHLGQEAGHRRRPGLIVGDRRPQVDLHRGRPRSGTGVTGRVLDQLSHVPRVDLGTGPSTSSTYRSKSLSRPARTRRSRPAPKPRPPGRSAPPSASSSPSPHHLGHGPIPRSSRHGTVTRPSPDPPQRGRSADPRGRSRQGIRGPIALRSASHEDPHGPSPGHDGPCRAARACSMVMPTRLGTCWCSTVAVSRSRRASVAPAGREVEGSCRRAQGHH
jgi:hypothetical protein